KANIAAGYSLAYILSVLGIVLLVRNLPGMFGYDPVTAAREAEKSFGAKGAALPGTSAAFDIGMPEVGVRVLKLEHPGFAGKPALEVFDKLGVPVLKITRGKEIVKLTDNPKLERGDLLTLAGPIDKLLPCDKAVGPEVADSAARHLDVDQAEIVVMNRAEA